MAGITFETGVKTWDVLGRAEIAFNPTSAAFLKRLQDTVESLDAAHETAAKADGSKFDALMAADKQMRNILDSVFGDGFCAKVFPPDDMTLLDLAGGLPIWANFILAIMEQMDESLTA